MSEYEKIRQRYKPNQIKVLLVAESPPPAADIQSSRHFYRSETTRKDDRLFINTIKALYPEAAEQTEMLLEPDKEKWLRQFQNDGFYMIEALEESLPHHVTKLQRQKLIREHLPRLLERIQQLTKPSTSIILIKSNVFETVAEPLRAAGYHVLNKTLVDYPGQYNQRDYRNKLRLLLS